MTAFLFPPAPTGLRRPSEPIVRTAQIEGNYRWTATRAWGAGDCILWCCTNPSDADHRHDDPTMWRMMSFSCGWGFGSMVVVNVYPFISANMAALRLWRRSFDLEDRSAKDAWLKNMDVVSAQLCKAETYVAAWGNGVDAEDLELFLDTAKMPVDTSEHDGFGMMPVPVTWMCLGKTGLGAPIHPHARGAYRVPDDAKLTVWRKAEPWLNRPRSRGPTRLSTRGSDARR